MNRPPLVGKDPIWGMNGYPSLDFLRRNAFGAIVKSCVHRCHARIVRTGALHRFTRGVPKRVAASTADWIEGRSGDPGSAGAVYRPLRGSDVTEQASPLRIDPADPDRYKWNRPWQNYGTFVLEARGLRYDGLTHSVVTPDHTLLYDVSRQWPDRPEEHALMKSVRLPRPRRVAGRTLLLSGRACGDNYFNWLTMALPRVWLAREADYDCSAFDTILVNRVDHGYQRECLERLQIPLDRLCASEGGGQWFLDHAVVPSLPYQAGFVRRWAIERLRDLFVGALEESGPVRRDLLYVSRSDARLRRVRNEDALLNRLEQRGFTAVSFTGKSVSEQARMMSRARCVVAPHGAGLTNLVFAPDGIDVVELHARDYYSSSFWWISTRMGNRHAVLHSRLDPQGNPWPEQSIEIDLDRLESHLDEVLEKEPTFAPLP